MKTKEESLGRKFLTDERFETMFKTGCRTSRIHFKCVKAFTEMLTDDDKKSPEYPKWIQRRVKEFMNYGDLPSEIQRMVIAFYNLTMI